MPLRPGGATCPVDEWAAVERAEQFRRWIDQRPHSLISLYPRYATEAAALHTVGRGSNNLLSGGLYRQPHAPDRPLIPGGVLVGGRRRDFDQAQVREHSRLSWFADAGPRHPTQVVVTPDRSRPESYSWATAPRYGPDDHVMQLGPLPELVLAEDPLTTNLVAEYGISAFLRQLVRWTRGAAARPPPTAHRRDHRASDRGLGHPAGPQPVHGTRRPPTGSDS